jgi:hypothetical protein
MNIMRANIVFKHWDEALAPVVSERLFGILQQSAPSETADSPRNSFVLKTLSENPRCLDVQFAPKIWPHIQQIHKSTSEWKSKFEAHKVIIMLASMAPDAAVKNAALTLITQTWQTFSDKQLREVLDYMNSMAEPSRTELTKVLLNQELTLAQNELQNPSDRTKERIKLRYERKDFVGDDALREFMLKTVDSSDAAFEIWRTEVVDYAKLLQGTFACETATKVLTLVLGSVTQPKRQGLARLFADVFGLVEIEKRPQLLQQYFDLCKHADPNIRNVVLTVIADVKASVEEPDFRLRLNTFARELFSKTTGEISAYRPAVDAVMAHLEAFGEYEWRDLGDLGKRLILQSDGALQDYGLSLVEQMPALPKVHEQDLVRQLVNIAKGGSGIPKQRAEKILDGLQAKNLGAEAKKSLKDYVKSKEKSETAE